MRKTTAMLLGIAFALPAAAQAQTANGTVNATATIEAILQVSTVQDLDFGSITPGSGATLTPGTAPGSGQLGVLQIQHNSDVNVTASLPATLDNGASSLPVSFSCGWSAAPSGVLAGGEASCNALGNRTGPADGTPMTSYVQVGGSIVAGDTNNRVPGTYTGSLTFTFLAVY